MLIRKRIADDVVELVEIVRRVHERDGYPIYLPDDDVDRFITEPVSVAAWVAVDTGDIIGHVALNEETTRPTMDLVDIPSAAPAIARYRSRG